MEVLKKLSLSPVLSQLSGVWPHFGNKGKQMKFEVVCQEVTISVIEADNLHEACIKAAKLAKEGKNKKKIVQSVTPKP